jgi:hypothetical protein
MTYLRETALILVAVLVCSTLGNSGVIAQVSESARQADPAFTGIHRNEGINGGLETVTITDGKTYVRITEQEYRQRGYAPEFHRLPTLIVERLPVRIAVPPDDRN